MEEGKYMVKLIFYILSFELSTKNEIQAIQSLPVSISDTP